MIYFYKQYLSLKLDCPTGRVGNIIYTCDFESIFLYNKMNFPQRNGWIIYHTCKIFLKANHLIIRLLTLSFEF